MLKQLYSKWLFTLEKTLYSVQEDELVKAERVHVTFSSYKYKN